MSNNRNANRSVLIACLTRLVDVEIHLRQIPSEDEDKLRRLDDLRRLDRKQRQLIDEIDGIGGTEVSEWKLTEDQDIM